MNLSAAFGAMVGIGASTLISVRLGQQDYKAAQDIFGNVVTLTLILGVLFSIVSLVFLDPILNFFGASPATLPYAREYMEIILLGNVITHSFFTFNAILRSTGHPQLAMNATIMAVVGNTILNPIFIRRPKELIKKKKNKNSLNKKIVKDTFAIGMSPFLMNSCACLVVILINRGLGQYGGDLAIGAYGIVNRVLFIFIMIVIGLNQGMQPIAGYNYGAQDYHRVLKVLRYTLLWGTLITTTGFLIGELLPELCVRAFTTDEELTDIAVKGMRIVVIFYPLIGMQMVTTNFFQSIGQASKSIFLSLTRQLLFLIPLLLTLPQFWGVKGVWLAMPISDAIACIVAGIMLITAYRKFKKLAV